MIEKPWVRVKRGAELLDKKKPTWYKAVLRHRRVLRMESCTNCVLGLNYGQYRLGMRKLQQPEDAAFWNGFISIVGVPGSDARQAEYIALAKAWVRRAIATERRQHESANKTR